MPKLLTCNIAQTPLSNPLSGFSDANFLEVLGDELGKEVKMYQCELPSRSSLNPPKYHLVILANKKNVGIATKWLKS